MPQSATLPTGGSGGGGFEGLSTPVKLGLIGGVAGLAFFLWHRMNAGGGGGAQQVSGDTSSYGIPNTAVMLGSLQEEMLNLLGQQGSDTANLTDLISGGFENVGSQLDAQTAVFQSALGDLQKNVIDNQNANTKSILDSLSARSDILGQLISSSSGAEQAAINSFAQSTQKGLDAITAQQNAEQAAIGALGNQVTTGQADLIAKLHTLQNTTTGLQSQITVIGTSIDAQGKAITNIQGGITNLQQLAGTYPEGTFVKSYDPKQGIYGIGVIQHGTLMQFSSWNQFIQAGGNMADIGNYPTIAYSAYATMPHIGQYGQ